MIDVLSNTDATRMKLNSGQDYAVSELRIVVVWIALVVVLKNSKLFNIQVWFVRIVWLVFVAFHDGMNIRTNQIITF